MTTSANLRGSLSKMQLHDDVRGVASEIGEQYGSRPASAPAAHRDMTQYQFGPPLPAHPLAVRFKKLKQEANEKRQEDIDAILDEITRVCEFGIDQCDHIEWSLQHGLLDREGALDIASRVGQRRVLQTSPARSPAPVITTSEATQTSDNATVNSMPVSWTESTAARPSNVTSTGMTDQATTTQEPPVQAPSASTIDHGTTTQHPQLPVPSAPPREPQTIDEWATNRTHAMGGPPPWWWSAQACSTSGSRA